jgi:hypothetical protein
MQALKVNSSDSGATTWLRSQIKFVKFDIQYMGSRNKAIKLQYRTAAGDWPAREEFIPGKSNVKYMTLVNCQLVPLSTAYKSGCYEKFYEGFSQQ